MSPLHGKDGWDHKREQLGRIEAKEMRTGFPPEDDDVEERWVCRFCGQQHWRAYELGELVFECVCQRVLDDEAAEG